MEEGRQDEPVTQFASEKFTAFVTELEEVMDGDQEDSDDEEDFPISSLPESSARTSSLALFPLGELPETNNDSVPDKALRGIPEWKRKLFDIFSEEVVGVLPSMTTIGAAK